MSLNGRYALLATFMLLISSRMVYGQSKSTLSDVNSAELQRILATQQSKLAIGNHTLSITVDDLMSIDGRHPAPKNSFERLLKWNGIALETTALDHTPVSKSPGVDPRRFGEQLGPHKSSRAMAIVHIAMFEAVNAVSRKYASYTNLIPSSGSVSVDAAIAKAAHDTLVWLYPSQTIRLDELYNQDRIVGDDTQIKAGVSLGMSAANSIKIMRENDHSDIEEPSVANIQPPLEKGQWAKDPLSDTTVALGGYWSKVKPFVMTSADQFRAPPPPKVSDPAFIAAYNDAKRLGGDPSAVSPGTPTKTERKDGETFVGLFWAYDGTPGLCAPPRLYNEVVIQVALERGVNSVEDMARLLALVNVAMADAGISAWEAKYHYRVQRPVTMIRSVMVNGNSAMHSDPNWTPIGAPITNGSARNFTPPFPAYPSGHATFGGAMFQVLRDVFRLTDTPWNSSFEFVSDEFNGENYAPFTLTPRPRLPVSFASFTDAEYQNAQSRIYLGIHWQFDADAGIRQGRSVGDYVFNQAFRPLN